MPAIRVKTETGWQDIAIQGATGANGTVDVFEQPTEPSVGVGVGSLWIDTDAPEPSPATGPTGPAGPKGDPGVMSGAAGGDLAGNYPNPTLAQVPQVLVRRVAAWNCPNGAYTAVPWDTVVYEISGDMWNSGQGARLYAVRDGLYHAVGSGMLNAAAGGNHRLLHILHFPSGRTVGLGGIAGTTFVAAGGPRVYSSAFVRMVAGEYLEAQAYQDSGAALAWNNTALTEGSFAMTWISP